MKNRGICLMLKLFRSRAGFAMLEFVMNFIIIAVVLGTIFSIAVFMNAYIKAMIMTRNMVVRPIELYGGFSSDMVRERIGLVDNPNPDSSFIGQMNKEKFTDVEIKVEAYPRGGEGVVVLTPLGPNKIVQLRTPIKVTMSCKYTLVYYDLYFADLSLDVPMTVVSYGQTEAYFTPDAGVEEYSKPE